MLFTRDGHNAFLGDMYRGFPAFLICGGPSLKTHDLSLLNQRGILTLAVNNAATVYRPHLWTSVDDPGNFADAIWYDPGILKFVPLCHMEKRFTVRNDRGELVSSPQRVGDMPGVFGYRRNERFVAEQFLYEDTFNWGNHSNLVDAYGNKGSRSIMLVALRLLFYLGVRTIYLLGCDFRMQLGRENYAFPQDRTAASVKGNNDTYRTLNIRLRHLLPYLAQEQCEVFNCTPDSGLTVFPSLSFEEAVAAACRQIPNRVNTEGMYDRARRKSDRNPAKEAVISPTTKPVKKAADVTGAKLRVVQAAVGADHGDRASNDIPPLTLVVPLKRSEIAIWRETAATWLRFKPWMTKLPLLLLHDGESALERLEVCSQFSSAREIGPSSQLAPDGDVGNWPSQLRQIAAQVSTPWYLYLKPQAVACNAQPDLQAEWFQPSEDGRLPAFMAPPWGYSKPANILTRLDAWADQNLFLFGEPTTFTFESEADRIRHPTVASWFVLGRSDWTRDVAELITSELPDCELGTFLTFFATRRQDHFLRIPFKRYGWEYAFGRTADPAKRCREILAGKAS